MNAIPLAVAAVSFGLPAAVYAVVTGLLSVSMQRSPRSMWLYAATAGTALWGLTGFGLVWATTVSTIWFVVIDTAHLALWVGFLGSYLRHAASDEATRMGNRFSAAAVVLFAVVALTALAPVASLISPRLQIALVLAVPLAGLLGLEQVYRNSPFAQRSFLQLLTIAIGWIFVINIFVYSQALLFGSVGLMSLSLRGLGVAAAAPAIVLAVKRQPHWGENLYVSRHVVFYTTSLTTAGLYLLAMAGGGYVIGVSGLTWSPVLQAGFLVLSGAILLYVLFSRTLRTRYRVFLAKHFYRNRYDYRDEWLRLVRTLAGGRSELALRERGIQALAEIIGSSEGELWLRERGTGAFVPYGVWPSQAGRAIGPLPESLVDFVRDTGWVVDTTEYRIDPEKYANAFASIDDFIAKPAIIVPLVHDDELVGVVRLARPAGLGRLGFEDHDLLKTAGRQVAIFLIQERDQEELSEARQFEAFSRLTTFLMHDLKNMIAQQELVVGNAKRHKHRPEFIDDAISTMDASVQRMRRLLERLRSTEMVENASRVDVAKLLYEVASACADREPAPRIIAPAEHAVWVSIDREKLAMAVTHAIRNAQDATDASGHVDLGLTSADGRVRITVRDSGAGMDEGFVRARLFRPFDSTKGAKGMGIGAYQIRETARSVGGDVAVESSPGRGTVLTIELPSAAAHSPDPKSAAAIGAAASRAPYTPAERPGGSCDE